jgi:murein DD-endopeptidase MepM/ murein hydrolase activator NlpD
MKKRTAYISGIMARLVLAGFLVLLCSPCSCALPKGVYHTVRPGQTLYSIGRVYQVDVDVLARVNHLRDRSSISAGQRLFIPGATRVKYVPPTVKTRIASQSQGTIHRTGPSVAVDRASPGTSKPAGGMARSSNRAAGGTTAKTRSAGAPASKEKFSWPVKGSVLKKFGNTNGTAGKGMEIAVPSGSAVRAAAAGKVIYSGDGIKGYGNLIILKHDESFFTVYGFNRQNLVGTGGFVSKGERIALSGAPPGGGPPRLHFEIRQGKDAVNPLHYLP